MKLAVLALDYDGTVAEQGTLHPEVRAAIREARALGVAVLFVSGRILEELRGVAGDLRLVDAVVAENGAVVAFPHSGHSLRFGSAPPPAFLDELRRRGVPFAQGECVVEMNALHAEAALGAVRLLELPLTLLFNRERLMVLPQGISKATGLRHALRALRLSEHNAVALGDAENDHALLEACEIGVAVGWGSQALCTVADEVLPGSGPAAVAGYIRDLLSRARLTPPRAARHRLVLGQDELGAPLTIPERGRNLLVAGDPRSGKSWAVGLLCEQLILQHYSLCVIDPEGDYLPLAALPGVALLGGDEPPPRPVEIERALRHPDVSVVINLSPLEHDAKRAYVTALLPILATQRRQGGLPHRIVVDEAHYFLHDAHALELLDWELGGYTLATYRASELHPGVLAGCEAVILTRVTDPHEVQTLLGLSGGGVPRRAWHDVLAHLSLREAALLPRPFDGQADLLRFHLAPRLTPHVRHRQKYLDMPVAEHLAFAFSCAGVPIGRLAHTLQEFTVALAEISTACLDGHLRRGDFGRWLADVYGDHTLAAEVRDLEHLYALRQLLDPRDALIQRVQERYLLEDSAA